jgi:hypothetical protein
MVRQFLFVPDRLTTFIDPENSVPPPLLESVLLESDEKLMTLNQTILNIPHQTMAYDALIYNNIYTLWQKFLCSL